MHKGIIGLVVVLLIGSIIVSVWNQSNVSTVENCKVMDLQQQQLIKGSGGNMSTETRYFAQILYVDFKSKNEHDCE